MNKALHVERPDDGIHIDLPSLIALRQEATRLDIAPRRAVLATRSGGHLSRFRGRGVEFDESRVYQPGDDPRNMDWRVTARSGQPHVKLYREERERPIWLSTDLGSSMRFGTRVAFKSVIAARATALLAWAAAEKGDRVGGLVFDEAHHVLRPPASRSRGVLPLLHALSTLATHDANGGYDGIVAAADHLAGVVKSGSLVFVISDFVGLRPDTATWMARLGERSELVLVQVVDPIELEAPPAGRYAVSDGVARDVLDTSIASVQTAWRQRFATHTHNVSDACRRYRAHRIELRTDKPVGKTLRAGLHPRRATRPGAR